MLITKLLKLEKQMINFISTQENKTKNKLKDKLVKKGIIRAITIVDSDSFLIELKNNLKIYCRSLEHSDYLVFNQIFGDGEYEIIKDILKFNKEEQPVIIDAGANVGYTSVFFLSEFKKAKLYAVEPSLTNYQTIEKNIFHNGFDGSHIKLYNKALHNQDGLNVVIENEFRDKKDWAFTTKITTEESAVKSITVQHIMKENMLDIVDFLKIDIEGAERFIFESQDSCAFLEKVKIIAIEIHDEFNVRTTIETILKSYGFILFPSGELTIGMNRNYF